MKAMHAPRRFSLSRILMVGGLALLIAGAGGLSLRMRDYIDNPVQAAADIDALLGNDASAYIFPVLQPQPNPGLASLTGRAGANGQVSAPSSQVPEPGASDSGFIPLPTQPAGAEPADRPPIPSRIVIDAIQLDAPVVQSGSKVFTVRGQKYEQWTVPDFFAAGWNPDSSTPGKPGNTVLFGHHNYNGAVFANLYKLVEGDEITLYAGDRVFKYRVQQTLKVKEKGVTFDQMLENAKWIQNTADERLTLVTCWPPYESTHRLIIVAAPVQP